MQGKKPLFGLTVGAGHRFCVDFCDLHFGWQGRGITRHSEMEKIKEITIVLDGNGKWLVVNEFYRLHYECLCDGPVLPVLREALKPVVGDGDHLVYSFGRW